MPSNVSLTKLIMHGSQSKSFVHVARTRLLLDGVRVVFIHVSSYSIL
jgi:hypothetical protein